MLTVKAIYTTGNEWTFEAEDVTRVPASHAAHSGMTDAELRASSRDTIFVKRPNGVHEQFDEGSIYVMNSHGSTVSVYHLGSDLNVANDAGSASGLNAGVAKAA